MWDIFTIVRVIGKLLLTYLGFWFMVLPFSLIMAVFVGAFLGVPARDWPVFWLWFTVTLFAVPIPIALWNALTDRDTPSYDPMDNPHPWGTEEWWAFERARKKK